jgi:hypothetical protein
MAQRNSAGLITRQVTPGQWAAVTSTSSAWAVGTYENGTGQSNIVLHWNGRKRAHVNSPSPGTQNGLSGVAASSASNVWAVSYFKTSGPEQAFALHCC